MTNVKTWLTEAAETLRRAGIGTARLDALVLLEDVTGTDRAKLLAGLGPRLSQRQQTELAKLLKRRAAHEPLAYIRGKTEFYGREFVLTPAVLEPRPESEAMIGLLGRLLADGKLPPKKTESDRNMAKTLKIADVGAGSGALGITAKLEFSGTQDLDVTLLEIDPEALKIAKINVEKYTTNISVKESDLLKKSGKDYDVLLCNLPYVPDSHTINRAAMHEPKLAIFGGPDGLDVYRRLFRQIDPLKKRPLYILTESLPPQHGELAAIAKRHDYKLTETDDFIQVFRGTWLQL